MSNKIRNLILLVLYVSTSLLSVAIGYSVGMKSDKCGHDHLMKVRCFKPTDDEEPPHDHEIVIHIGQ